MPNRHAAILLGLCVAAAACAEKPVARTIAPPDAAAAMNLAEEALALRSVDLSALEDVGATQAATGGRLSGHADIPTFGGAFRDHYSLVGLSTDPAPGAKGEFEGGYETPDGSLVVRFHADIDCLVVIGNQAWASGPIREYIVNGVSLPPGNRQIFVNVTDRGEGAKSPPDLPSFIGETFSPQICRLRLALAQTPNEKGNLQVEQP